MVDTIPSLWPKSIRVNIQSPYTILRVQAALLGKVTRGISEGVVETERTAERVQHRLVVVAPASDGYRHTILRVWHSPDLPYPVEVDAESLRVVFQQYPTAYSDEQLTELVAKVLQSDDTTAIISALIAKSNEANEPEDEPSANGNGTVR